MKNNLQGIALYFIFSCYIPISFANAFGAEYKTDSEIGIEGTSSIARLQQICTPWSTLECNDIPITVPFNLDWASDEGGVVDAANVGSGFTAIAPPSGRNTDLDGAPTNPEVPGYEPSKLNVNTSTGKLNITTNRGIFFKSAISPETGNSQINALAVGFDARSNNKKIVSKLTNLPVPGSRDFQQAGIWFGLNEAQYVKLNVISHTYGNNNYEVQLVYELSDVYQLEQTITDVIAPGNDILLQMILDQERNRVQGFYSVDNGQTYKSTGPAVEIAPSFFNGVTINEGGPTMSFAGIFATQRNSPQQLVYSFDSFSMDVLPAVAENLPPTLDPISNPLPIAMNAEEQTIELTGITAGQGETQTLTVIATSNNPDLIPNPQVQYTSPNNTGTLTYTPVAGMSGRAEITVRVTDSGSNIPPNENTITRTFIVTVSGPDNNAPTLDPIANPAPINEDAPAQTVNLTGITSGGDAGQTLTVTATSDNVDLIPNPTVTYTSPNATGTLTFTPVANAFGTANITVTVTDSGPGTAPNVNTFSQTFTVVVNPVNDPPTISEIPDQETEEGVAVGPINFTIGDVDNNINELVVTAASDNLTLVPNASIALGGTGANRTITVTPAADQSGSVVITITVSDGELQATESFTLEVGSVTSIGEGYLSKGKVTLYPNPTENEVELILENKIMGNVFIQVIDLNGRAHKIIPIIKQNEVLSYRFNVDDLARGAYIIQVKQDGLITFKKMIKR
ncbi:hypothetical protein BH23BAC1_BH23BAC1_35040 [soil metagenome]